jgi:hypothetical protein
LAKFAEHGSQFRRIFNARYGFVSFLLLSFRARHTLDTPEQCGGVVMFQKQMHRCCALRLRYQAPFPESYDTKSSLTSRLHTVSKHVQHDAA